VHGCTKRIIGLEISLVARFAPNVRLAQKSFWAYLMELLGDVGQVEACFGLLGEGVNLGTK
jgi:hypothetical protein